MVSEQEQRILDELEDARDSWSFLKKIIGIWVTLTVSSIGIILSGNIFDLPGKTAFNVIFGMLLFVLVVAACILTALFFEENENPKYELKKAERKYRDYLNRQAEG